MLLHDIENMTDSIKDDLLAPVKIKHKTAKAYKLRFCLLPHLQEGHNV